MITINLDNWRMKDYVGFFDVSQGGNLTSIFEAMSQIVTAWAYEGDPASVEAYGELLPSEWREVQKAVSTEIAEKFQTS